MATQVHQPLGNATPRPAPAKLPAALPRWLVIGCAVLVGWWLLRRLVGIAASISVAADPAQQVGFLLHWYLYDLIAIAVCAAAYVLLRRRDRGRPRRTCYLAVFSALLLVLNPFVLDILFRALHLRGGYHSEMGAFKYALVAGAAGLVAAIRIRRSRGTLTGMPWAIAGALIGGAGVVLVIVVTIAFLSAMSHW